jgi:uncharacterized protein (DUF1330 family)
MAAYFIAQYVVTDPKLYREYQGGAGPTIQASGGELVSFDVAAETIEGTPPGPQTVIVKFESGVSGRSRQAPGGDEGIRGHLPIDEFRLILREVARRDAGEVAALF